jgi:NADPH:quinone reductase-like Zn-dependent oxidoreductase
MKAVVVRSYKKPLEVTDVAEPAVGDREVLVQVEATGLNQLDEKLRAGDFRLFLPYKAPFVLGHDVAGTVLSVGADVTEFTAGDLVYGRPGDGRIGTFAERVTVPADDLALRPRTISAVEAASLPLVALTAWQALVEVAQVRPGDRVLVHAGSGGVGTIAIQLAKHLGATVATTAGAAKSEVVRELGADVVIDYRDDAFDQVLSGYDVVLDSVGGDNLMRSLSVLKPGGVAIGIAGPPTPAFARTIGAAAPLRLLMAALSRKVRKRAASLGVRYEFLFMRASGPQLAQIAALVDDGALRPVVGRQITFDEVPAALTVNGQDGTIGKTVATLI